MPSRSRSAKVLPRLSILDLGLAALLIIALVFGGASRQHALRLALVELAAIPVLVMATTRLAGTTSWREHRLALGLLAAVVAIPLVQLIPLPDAIWTRLPGREQLVLALDVAGVAPSWAPITMAPDLTRWAALALLPPCAMFLATLAAPLDAQPKLLRAAFIMAVLGSILGALQLASGGERFYQWPTTSAGSVTGFFANRNHMATLLLALIPFAAAAAGRGSRRPMLIGLPAWFGVCFIILAIVMLAAIRSRAGIVFLPPTLALSMIVAWTTSGHRRPSMPIISLAAGATVALIAVAVFALPGILDRFDARGANDGRLDRWPTVVAAAASHLPVGAGVGAFDPIYRSVEPLEELDETFFNQAHNDYLEIWLETGWLGVGALAVFFFWYLRRTIATWRQPPSSRRPIQQAATIAIAVVLCHSAIDYPVRTVTISVLLALCFAILETGRRPLPQTGSV